MTEEDYVVRKSNMVKSLFSSPPVRGLSEKEFLDSIRMKILSSVSFEPTFFNDVKIEGRSMLDYYSSFEATIQEKEFFTKTFNDIEVLRKFQFNQNHFFNFISNLGNALLESDDEIYSKQLKFAFKIIETEWSRDIDSLILDKYNGNNVLSHLLSYGFKAALFVNNEITDKVLKTRSLNENKVKFLSDNTNSNMFIENFYFDLLYFSYENNPEEANYIAKKNKEIVSENLIFADSARYIQSIENSFLLFEKDRLERSIDFKEINKKEPTKKNRMRL